MRNKLPVRLTGLVSAHAPWGSLHPEPGDLPRCFTLNLRNYYGPGNLDDGRMLSVSITPAELSQVLGALPILSMADDTELIRAWKLITNKLEGKGR